MFAQKDYEKLIETLDASADLEYKAFHEKLVPNIENVKGVRSPVLKALSKEIGKNDPSGFIDLFKPDSYEEIMIHGFVLGFMKADIEKRLECFENFMPYITNWAVCDGVVANFKFKTDEEEVVFRFLQKYMHSSKEYELRVVCVFLMDYFIKEEYIDIVLDYYNNLKSDKYYVNMAVAWGISICFVKFPEKTMMLLENNSLDKFTYNKALQKIVESRRVDQDTKKIIKSMKRK